MTSLYTKRGATTRLEISRDSRALVESLESGEALSENGTLRSRSTLETVPLSPPDSEAAALFARTIEQLVVAPVELERLTLLAGITEQTFRDHGAAIGWSEEIARLHLTLLHRPTATRLSIDLGESSLQAIDVGLVREVVSALASYEGKPALDWRRLELSPLVSAELWPLLAHAPIHLPESVRIAQGAHPGFARDGQGSFIEPLEITDSLARSGSWPNVYRPSYRGTPRRMPFHLTASGPRRDPGADLVAITSLGGFQLDELEVRARLLCRGKNGASLLATVGMPLAELAGKIVSVSEDRIWMPNLAGSYGCRVVLES